MELIEIYNALNDADVNSMSAEEKEEYKKLVEDFLSNSEVKRDPRKNFVDYDNFVARYNGLTQNNTTTSQQETQNSNTSSNNNNNTETDEGEYKYGTEGVYNDWEELVDLNVFNSIDLAAIAPQAESYIKADISTINRDNMDKYLRGLEQILNNTGFKTDPIYRSIYDMAQSRLNRLSNRSDLTEAQKNKISNLKEVAQNAREDNTGNELIGDRENGETGETDTSLENRAGSKAPETMASLTGEQKTSPDDIISEAKNFLNTGKNNQGIVTIDGDSTTTASNMLFNVLFSIGVGAALLIGIYLGIKFMLASAEDKASIKESLIPYFAGVIVMFASFSIWKLVLVLLQNIENI